EGEDIVTNIGRFGAYVKYGSKYVSLKEDPYTVTLEHALECIRLKIEADANRIIQDFAVDNIQVLNGRYGPYISNKEKNARIPKDRDPKSITLEEARALLEAAPVRPMRGRGRFGKKAPGGAGKSAAGKGAGKGAADKGAAATTAAKATPPKEKPVKTAATKAKSKSKTNGTTVQPPPAAAAGAAAAPKKAVAKSVIKRSEKDKAGAHAKPRR
ncbi:MAG TPA: topoisomerase C-terminal repeat-containing protein, partial [Steroidobacteraceae bacterium]|nr:topoisomerase C-terminal repeat-containing protein [Steroidobacteraceae bacterium]